MLISVIERYFSFLFSYVLLIAIVPLLDVQRFETAAFFNIPVYFYLNTFEAFLQA